jgi:S-adenosylmethionine:tRNA ribosyltransferase-isomerase
VTALSDFDFDLPPELIAQEAAPRGESRLLVLSRGTGDLVHASIRDLPRFLRVGDLLVANDTRVFPARLLGHRVPSGGAVECLLLQREQPPNLEPRSSNLEPSDLEVWSALMHPGQKLKRGARVLFERGGVRLHGEVLGRHYFGRRTIRLSAETGSVADAIQAVGHIPLPPYIHRADTADDRERYQTIFARQRGSVAAPTAGLHFDRALLDDIDAAGVERTTITLHVGYGTFKPVRADRIEDHVVDPEPYLIGPAAAAALNRARAEHRRILAVGTTTTRALENAAIRGAGRIEPGRADADIFIYPGFAFQVVGALITNFHLPKSSLLMLVSAFAGRPSTGSGPPELVDEGRARVLAAYREAVAQRYRFYSYGDAMLIV